MNINTERDLTLDVAKGISIILMTIGHLELMKNYPLILSINREYFYFFKMPLFIFITGLLFTKNSTLNNFIINKFDSLIKPIITLFILVFCCNFFTLIQFDSLTIKEAFIQSRRFILYESMFPLWFPFILFMSLILFKSLHTINEKYAKIYFFSLALLLLFLLSIINRANIEIYIFKFHAILYFFLILLIGYITKKENYTPIIFSKYILLLSLIVFGISISFKRILLVELDLFENKFGSFIPTFIIMISGIIIILNLAKLISKNKILAILFVYCSYSSFFILAFHILIGNYLLYPIAIKYFGVNLYVDIAIFILTLVICCLLYKLTFKIKKVAYFILPMKSLKNKTKIDTVVSLEATNTAIHTPDTIHLKN